MSDLLEAVEGIARLAGAAIITVYESADFGVEAKADDSPLTKADLAAHQVIIDELSALDPATPILSEEGTLPPWSVRESWDRYWLIDPLDGTKEFVSRNGEFTVNIALIESGVPVLGVVYVPVLDVMYAGDQRGAAVAFKESGGERRDIRIREVQPGVESLTVVGSRRHGSDALAACIERLREKVPQVDMTSMGSSLKICLIAEGEADLYPRLAPTSEWDTAAAQAVLEAAGGKIVDTAFAPLRYNGKDNILNPHFYVYGSEAFPWREVLDA